MVRSPFMGKVFRKMFRSSQGRPSFLFFYFREWREGEGMIIQFQSSTIPLGCLLRSHSAHNKHTQYFLITILYCKIENWFLDQWLGIFLLKYTMGRILYWVHGQYILRRTILFLYFPLRFTQQHKLKKKIYRKQGWQHPQKWSSETVGQTKINTCGVSELKNQNINVYIESKL